MIAGTSLVAIAALLFSDWGHVFNAETQSVAAVIYLGIFPTALATLIYFYLILKIGAARISQINFAVPVFGSLIGVLILNERMETNAIMALAMILLAVYLVSKRKKQA